MRDMGSATHASPKPLSGRPTTLLESSKDACLHSRESAASPRARCAGGGAVMATEDIRSPLARDEVVLSHRNGRGMVLMDRSNPASLDSKPSGKASTACRSGLQQTASAMSYELDGPPPPAKHSHTWSRFRLPKVRTLVIRTGEAFDVYPLGCSSSAFHLPPGA